MATEALAISGIDTYYGDSHVLHRIGFTLQSGKLLGLLGRNGAGKTTCMSTIMGFLKPRSGAISLYGEPVGGLPPDVIARKGICLVPQGRRVFRSLTVRENLAVAAQTRNQSDKPWTIERVFALFPRLAERRHHGGNDLSGGEQQMLAIARALVANPRLLVMDEPTEGLAPAVVAEVGRLIRQLREDGISVLLVEQNAAFAVDVANVTHVMHQGTIVHSSAPEALWKNEEIKTQYLGVPGRS